VRKAISAAGTGGTLLPALEAIADQVNPVVIVVRVATATGEGSQDTLTVGSIDAGEYTGLQALLGAEAQLGVRPRIIGAPGLDTHAVTTALVTVAQKLRAMAYAAAIGADVATAVTYAGQFSARELMLLWPNTSSAFSGDLVARALGLRALIDGTQGWNKTLSNVALNGITGMSQPVYFDIQDSATDAGVLNGGNITCLVNANGYRLWGNRTTSDDPLFAFESATRASQFLQDTIAQGLLWAIDKPLTRGLITDIIETVNALFRGLVSAGRLVGASAWYDPAHNDQTALSGGKLVIDYNFTPTAPLESLTLNQMITDQYYADFSTITTS
jgi:phage tail sheath protein FI